MNTADTYATEYKRLLREGAEADALDRQRIAQRAKMAKEKYKIKKQQYKKNSVVLGTVVTIQGARELMERHDEAGQSNIEGIIQDHDADAGEIQERMMDQMIQFEIDMEVVQEIQGSFDLDLLSTGMDVEGSEEIELMEEMAAGELSTEQVDIDREAEIDSGETLNAGLDENLDDDFSL